jgi:outer membrane receptor protein involved in Fe transport
LIRFSAQSGVQVITSGAKISTLSTSGVIGFHPIESALEQILQGTPMTFRIIGGDTVVLVPRESISGPRQADQPRTPRPQNPPTTGSGPEASLVQVQVTGSRIVRRDLQSASPIVTVDDTMLSRTASFAVESVLNRLPQFVPTDTQFLTNDIFPSAINSPGISTLNLRGLGSNRTLVLIDGRRTQPANSTLEIDINSVPSLAVENVEIISGGASAVYGADAMAGVINFKFKDSFEGASLEYRSAITERGDGQENRISTLLGANTEDGRGNVMLGLEWWERGKALAIDHPFFVAAMRDPTTPATLARLNFSTYQPSTAAGGLPSQAAADALFADRPAGVDVNRLTSFLFNTDGSAFKEAGALGFNGPLGDGRYKLQSNGLLGENNLQMYRSSPLQRYSIFGRGRFELNEHVETFAQVSFASTEVESLSNPSSATGPFSASIPRDAEHPVPDDLAALLDSRGPNVPSTTQFDPDTGQPIIVTGADANWLLGRPLDFLPTRQLRNATDAFQILAGLSGDVNWSDWTWEAYASRGESRSDSGYIGYASLERYRAVVTAPFYGRGFTQTGPGQTASTCTSGLPIFENFQVSQDCIDAITVSLADRTRLTQDIVEANIQGALANLPTGELRGAAGLSYRRNAFEYLPDPLRETNNVVDIPVGSFANANVRGSTAAEEVYAELLIPLHTFELELGGRYSRYNTAGGVPTYKGLLSWKPNEFVRLRGGYQLANRAPNINELFLGQSANPVTLRGPDPCRIDTRDFNGNVPGNPNRAQVQALCSALIGTGTSTYDADPNNFRGDGRTDGGEIELRRGNEDLRSEKGQTYTFGVVFTSPFEHPAARDLTLTVDWYSVRISDAIALVSAQTAYDVCFNRDGISNPTYSLDDPNGLCRRIVRDGVTGNRDYVESQFANLGKLETSGVDLQFFWRVAPEDIGLRRLPGLLSLDLLLNKLITFKSQDFPTQQPLENAGTLARGGLFDYRTITTLQYALGNAHASLSWRHLPGARSAVFVTDPTTAVPGSRSYDILDLAGGFSVGERLTFTLGVDNLLDRDPNRTGTGPTSTSTGFTLPGYYDVLGRRYFAGVRLKF